jgi:hypothetical protein
MNISNSNGQKFNVQHPPLPNVRPSNETIRKEKLFEGKPKVKKK